MDTCRSGGVEEFPGFPDDFDRSGYCKGEFEADGTSFDEEFPGKTEMEMSYSDWTMGLESGTSWLPAYGFQQPSTIQEALLTQHDSFHDVGGYVCLETIIEETSDDLMSESDYSGWHGSDSGSVIHIPFRLNNTQSIQGECVEGDWSGSERDLAVPKKRRRREEEGVVVSRSSSLLQFETLERHCEHSLSSDSLDAPRWNRRYSDSLSSSDENLRSLSSFRSPLRSTRSYDSLVASGSDRQTLSGEFSQSLHDNSLTPEEEPEPVPPPTGIYRTVECLARVGNAAPKPAKKAKRSSENLSEDSGFGEHIPAKSGETWSKYNGGSWQSAPDLASRCRDPAQLAASLLAFTIDDDEEALVVPETKYVMESKIPATSTPNLYDRETEVPGELTLTFGDSTVSLSRALSFKKNFETEGMFGATSKGSNIQITTSFVSLGGTSGKAVSFVESEEVREYEEEGAKATDMVGGPATVVPAITVTLEEPCAQQHEPSPEMELKPKQGRFGTFFQRFSLRRLSGKDKKRKEKKKEAAAAAQAKEAAAPPPQDDLVRIIPLHGPDVPGKPPLPPRRRDPVPPATPPPPVVSPPPAASPAPSVMSARAPAGLLETDIDSDTTSCNPGKKARSLLSLGRPCPQPSQPPTDHQDNRAKSMEFLLDKENHHQAKPPENELQKVGERVMSEHELRVQRSLQRLNLPDWYRNTSVPQQGFLLGKRGSDAAAHWPGLGSKTTSLSSLGSNHSATPRSPTTGQLVSPSPTGFTRWSTSRLNSSPNSASTSPSGSARSSFNYRQPYLGWRSQERISRPRTPAERLAQGLLPLKQQQQNVPNLSEVHTSIKEVTSAIASYVSKGDDRLSPAMHRHDHPSSRSASPRGSKTQLCWLESSFVGSKPLEVPDTPMTAAPPPGPVRDLHLDLTSPHRPPVLNDAL